MDNIQLQDEFIRIIKINNSFDKFIALKQLKKAYKKSEFYKTTRLPIFSAYEWLVKNYFVAKIYNIKTFLTPTQLGEYITDVLDNIEPYTIEEFVNKLSVVFDAQQITDSTKEIGEMLKSLK